MKILLMVSHLNPGGVTRHVVSLQQGLQERGHEVWVAADDRWRVSKTPTPQPGNGILNLYQPFRPFHWGTKSELSWRLWGRLPSLARWITTERFDVIHAHTRVTQVLAVVAGRLTNTPVVTTCHGYFRPRWHRRIWPAWGEAVIAVSRPVADHLRYDFAWPAERIHVVYHGLDLKQWRSRTDHERERVRRIWRVEPREWIIGNVARLSSVKGWDVVVHAVARLKGQGRAVRLLIGNAGPQKDEVKRLIQTAGLQRDVIEAGDDEPRDLLCGMDVMIAPSRQEGLGLAVLEAQAVGVPVVVSDVGGHKDIVAHEETGLRLASFDPDAYAAAIDRLMQDASLRDRITAQARRAIESRFIRERMIRETERVYQTVIAKASGSIA